MKSCLEQCFYFHPKDNIMNKKQIVIVTEETDAHTDDMIRKLQEMKHDPIRLNTNDIPINITMSFSLNLLDWNGTMKIQTNGRVINIADIRSVWWRRPGSFPLPTSLSEQEIKFAEQELEQVLDGLWSSRTCYWISFPAHIRQAGLKMDQLKRATQLGFEVPRTLITTDPDEVNSFHESCKGKVIYKVMTDPFLAMGKVAANSNSTDFVPRSTFATLITDTELAMADSVRLTPCMFQEYIPKQLELRITVIGDEIFAAEIHSQENEKTRDDWRHYEVDIPYRKANLPTEIAERCLSLVRSYNLNFSAIDMILTPDGQYVFLENNPNGQFMFIEQKVPELRMTEALASCLIRGANS
jgi:glutathione synthase/RimK-type ligase-like ATP-grasp enzyme